MGQESSYQPMPPAPSVLSRPRMAKPLKIDPKHDVMAGPPTMHTNQTFVPPFPIPQTGMGLGMNK